MKLKIFTLEEANQLIPVVDALLKDFQQKHRRMQEVASAQTAPSSPQKKKEDDLSRLEKKATEPLKAIEQMGCVLRDPYEGLVDFPGIVNQDAVYLCWKQGEQRIRFYHGVEDGFKGRKPL